MAVNDGRVPIARDEAFMSTLSPRSLLLHILSSASPGSFTFKGGCKNLAVSPLRRLRPVLSARSHSSVNFQEGTRLVRFVCLCIFRPRAVARHIVGARNYW